MSPQNSSERGSSELYYRPQLPVFWYSYSVKFLEAEPRGCDVTSVNMWKKRNRKAFTTFAERSRVRIPTLLRSSVGGAKEKNWLEKLSAGSPLSITETLGNHGLLWAHVWGRGSIVCFLHYLWARSSCVEFFQHAHFFKGDLSCPFKKM